MASTLHSTARTGNIKKMMTLLGKGADVNGPDEAHQQTALVYAAARLMFAANFGLPETVQLLLEHGANVNAVAPSGFTPLMAAAIHSSPPEKMVEEIITLLLSAGADINATTNEGKTAAIFARERGHEQRVEWFNSLGQTDVGTGLSGAGFPGRTRA
jgi:ankyrin repeat protein